MKSRRNRFRTNNRTRRGGAMSGALGVAATTIGSFTAGFGIGAGVAAGAAGVYYIRAKKKRKKIIRHIIKYFSDEAAMGVLSDLIEDDIKDPEYVFEGITPRKLKKVFLLWYSYMGGMKVGRESYTLHYLMEIDKIERNPNITKLKKIEQIYKLFTRSTSLKFGWWHRALVGSKIISMSGIDRKAIKQYFKKNEKIYKKQEQSQKNSGKS